MKHIYKHLTLYSLLFCLIVSVIGNIIFSTYVYDKMKIFNINYHVNETNTYVITSLVGEIEIPKEFSNIKFNINDGMNDATSITVHKDNIKYYSKGNCIIEKETNKLIMTCKNSIIPLEVKKINCKAMTCFSEYSSINIKYEGTVADWLNLEIELEENYWGFKGDNVNILFNNNGNYNAEKRLVIPEGTIEIKDHIFKYFNYVEELILPSTLKRIGNYSFYGCKALTKVVLNEGLIDVGENVFADCINLVDINIPNSLTYFSDQMFWNCQSLKNVDIHSNIKQIGVQAFYKCALEEIYIPESVETIKSTAFHYCNKLKKISLPFIGENRTNEGIQHVSIWYIFGGSYYDSDALPKKLEEVVIYGDAVIKENYLEGAINIMKIYLLDNVKVISDEAFSDYLGDWEGIVYCEADSKPSDWSENWDQYVKYVEWGYNG